MPPRKQTLTVAVPETWRDTEFIETLVEQGHRVVFLDFASYDLVLAPQAHQMNADLLPVLPDAISAAKRRRKESAHGS
jgi:hypothetical protein